MRTTIAISDDLHRQAKQAAHDAGKTLGGFIEDALREVLARRNRTVRRACVRIPTFKGHGLQPGVDLYDAVALEDLMREHDAGR